mmetsp:Transcript_31876/g.58959  ORF Transcript_31876/g.58959 Transcript_31876/m.58959 type:complete len:281 (-) Transcript_31876:54-896(-)
MTTMKHIPRSIHVNYPHPLLGMLHPRAEQPQHHASRQKLGLMTQHSHIIILPIIIVIRRRQHGNIIVLLPLIMNLIVTIILLPTMSIVSVHTLQQTTIRNRKATHAIPPLPPPIGTHVMLLRHHQHPPHDIGGAHSFRTRNGSIPTPSFRALVHVLPVDDARIVAVHDVVHIVRGEDVIQVLGRHDVRTVGHHLVDEFASLDHGQTFVVLHQGRSLALFDGFVRVYADDQVGAQGASEAKGVHVSVVHDVERSVHEDSYFAAFSLGTRGRGGYDVFAFGC